MNKNRGQPQTMKCEWLVLNGYLSLPPALGETMGFLSLVLTQLPFFGVVNSSCGKLAWSPIIFRCQRERSERLPKLQDTGFQKETFTFWEYGLSRNPPNSCWIKEKGKCFGFCKQKNSKSYLLQLRFDTADYRIAPRGLLVLASSSASVQQYVPLPISLNTFFHQCKCF